ncbi:DNA-binding domain-containing protein [Luteithermobacter gelatinilyticus]|uniref:HvfC/BufC N-terminal domain-containing protein n=1 Tax=Luteithermobacter gelatinilyticus TaxID=2582913 RepID=UPI00143CFF9A|nr:DNA-binding domain-containing protein [Luteithermobacter gelatinilyticus]|tara:strand:+ start:11293 stop:12060 length:768 start_codon:yes stop_codon:yes gene_type:complete
MKLGRLQIAFRQALLSGDPAALARYVKGAKAEAGERVQIHQNNVLLSLKAALADNFPVVHKLVGDDFFQALSGEYIRKFPPQSPVLAEYGANFPTFLTTFRGAKDHPYLADMARFERGIIRAARARDAIPLDPAGIEGEGFAHLEEMVLHFLPSVELFESPYPILEIWRSNQPDYAGNDRISLDQGGSRLAVYRPHLEVLFLRLEAANFDFIRLLKKPKPLGQAVRDILADYPDFDLQGALALILGARLVEAYSY